MPSERGSAFRRHFRRRHTDFGRCKRQRAAFRKAADCGGCRISRAPLCRFPTYPICSEHIYEKEKNTAAGNLFGGFVCLYGDGGTPAPVR
ncbi:hypothetical protein [Neisseria polysaccharea]|uniref:hypothetical protein n=1 Tax=Neisseria polysaccharea TaxID=489 RepID=UPI001F3A7813|nr:hypothetical protein [Neisseria polysaccharea]